MGFGEMFFTVLGIVLLLGALRFFFRFVWPVVRQIRAMRRAQEDFLRRSASMHRQEAQGNPSPREGEVTVERSTRPAQRTIIREDIGETVEYEEVE